ncbi:MAG: chorismate mutase [Candidatus Shikimatogenerans sp. AspAUS03]|uniref:chorismate mutase n=1 Tax=Candidatus Shikimatogenerans sp. AspAUS03 TaxID=3158563 RepID=A0AAU7QVE4_9FLAO
MKNYNWIKRFNKPLFICGPCSLDKKKYFFKIIKKLYSYNIKIFRIGIWKPRTYPNNFEGLGKKSFKWIKQIKKKFKDILFATEIGNVKHISLCIKNKIDILWIGARTTTNPFLITEISKKLKNTSKIILIKNTIHNEIDLLLGCIKRLQINNIKNIGIIHRGCYNPYKGYYRNFIEWNIINKIKKKIPNLPIFFDPSHITGNYKFIFKLLKQSIYFQYSGYFIESHINPKKALSDNTQQLKPKILNIYKKKILQLYNKKINNIFIKKKRLELEELDKKIILILSNRIQIIKDIYKYKKKYNILLFNKKRYQSIIKNYKKFLCNNKIHYKYYILKIFKIIHYISLIIQK